MKPCFRKHNVEKMSAPRSWGWGQRVGGKMGQQGSKKPTSSQVCRWKTTERGRSRRAGSLEGPLIKVNTDEEQTGGGAALDDTFHIKQITG